MARSQSTDFLHNLKFHMKVVTTGVAGASNLGSQGGFNACTMPEISQEVVEYKEGRMLYKRKQAGEVTFNDITASHGVARGNTDFYDWIQAGVTGSPYKVDLQIRHFHRDEVTGLNDFTGVQPKRVINIFEAQASRVKLGGDLDATSSDISIAECDIAYESAQLVSQT